MNNAQHSQKTYKKYSDAEKINHVKNYLLSGIGYKKYAQMHGIAKNTLYQWILKYKDVLLSYKNIPLEPTDCSLVTSEKTIEISVDAYQELIDIKAKYNLIHSVLMNI